MARPRNPIFSNDEAMRLREVTHRPVMFRWYGEKEGEVGEKAIVSDDFELILDALRWQQLILKLDTAAEPIGFEEGRSQDKNFLTISTEDWRNLCNCWSRLNDLVWGAKEGVERALAPSLQAFHRSYFQLMMYKRSLIDVMVEERIQGKEYNDVKFVFTQAFETYKQLRQESAHKEKQLSTQMYRNRKSVFQYLDKLCLQNGGMYVVKCDLGYALGRPIQWSYKQIKAEFEALLAHRNRNPMWQDDLIGYFWKLADSPIRGLHYYLFLFYRPESEPHHRQDQEAIERRWCKEISTERGIVYEPIGSDGAPFEAPPDGLVRGLDCARFRALKAYVEHILKLDLVMRPELPAGHRVIGKGQLLKKKSLSARV